MCASQGAPAADIPPLVGALRPRRSIVQSEVTDAQTVFALVPDRGHDFGKVRNYWCLQPLLVAMQDKTGRFDQRASLATDVVFESRPFARTAADPWSLSWKGCDLGRLCCCRNSVVVVPASPAHERFLV